MIITPLPDAGDLISILLLAFVFDIMIGEPPAALHPVVWIGKVIGMLKNAAPDTHRKAYGVFLALATIIFASGIGYLAIVISLNPAVPQTLGYLIAAYFLKSTFAIRSLLAPAQKIHDDLVKNNLKSARSKLPIYVSRNPSKLNTGQMSSAVIESMAENFVDGILTPIFYYVLLGPFGLVGAYAYKAVNTLDSMVGYRDDTHLELGYFSAKLDDVLNWIPARISVLFIAIAALFPGTSADGGRIAGFVNAIKSAKVEGQNTPSPNSGYPIAAASGALGIRLEKPNIYVLGPGHINSNPDDIKRASQLIGSASVLSVAVFCIAVYIFANILNT
ncbi:MAG TPA: cobalamin biosynthesis protein [Methanosarcinaceae archaeon]|nr:cobalamin biosynthesis protein [Methanosarcinaceae archaeon]